MPVNPSSTPFLQALQRIAQQAILPTSAGTYGLDTIPAQIRERSLFMARIANAEAVQRAHSFLTSAIGGGRRDESGAYIPGSYVDQATFRLGMKDFLRSIGFTPETGADGIPSAEPGSLKDLSSDARLNLVYQTNLQLAQGYGANLADQHPARLDAWPAQELYRLEPRKERRPWGQRWNDAIQRLGIGNTSAKPVSDLMAESNMIALKNDRIWTEISRFGLPYPPYDFGSGMWIRDISRQEAMAAGVMTPDTPSPAPILPSPLNSGLQADISTLAPALQQALSAFGQVINGVFHLANRDTIVNSYNPGQPRDSLGKWVDANGGGLSERHNIARGKRAMRRALRHETDVQKAMYRHDVGQIDFEWGTPGIKAKDWETGKGISHVARKHPQDAMKIPEAIAKGKLRPHPDDPEKRIIEHNDMLVVLKKTNSRKGWLLSGYSRRKVQT